MNCPLCKDEPMLVLELNKVEIDYCSDCGGIWLDSGELELLMESSAAKEELLNSFQTDKNNKEDKRKCPICLRNMDKVFCGDQKEVLLDKCPSGHGLWFDEGELHDVISMGALDKENKILNMLKDIMENRLKRGNPPSCFRKKAGG